MPKKPSHHGTLPERTYERLRDLIVRGRIQPGARVVESEVAERFGISRTPVREALLRLMHERYLAPVSEGRRTELVVAGFSPDDVRELWGIIGALESYAIACVAALPRERRMATAADLEGINESLAMAAMARPRDPDRLFELQAAFHLRFIDEVAGPHLHGHYNGLRPQVQRYEWIYGTRVDADYETSTAEHLRIISAVQAGDATAARTAVCTHWENAAERTASIITALTASPATPGPAVSKRRVERVA